MSRRGMPARRRALVASDPAGTSNDPSAGMGITGTAADLDPQGGAIPEAPSALWLPAAASAAAAGVAWRRRRHRRLAS